MPIAPPELWRPGTMQAAIADSLRENDLDAERTYRALLPHLGEEPFVFTTNGPTGRVPLPRGSKRAKRFRYRINEVRAVLTGEAPAPAAPAAPKPIVAPEPTADRAIFDRFYAELERLRKFCDGRDHDTLNSHRPMVDGVKALKAGLPIDGVIASLTATWSEDTRRQADVTTTFDFAGWKRPKDAMAHGTAEYVAGLVKAGVNVWLHGPAGTGKSSAARYAADRAGLDYYEVNLAGAMVSAIKGKDRLKEFIESEFTKAYRDGGVLCLEEFDAAHPTVATAVNNAIANGHFYNDASGQVIKRHDDFRIIVTANTLGTGGTKEFNSRLKLDGATLDRFRIGRVEVKLDRNLDRNIFESMVTA
jgi:hypothetical protein